MIDTEGRDGSPWDILAIHRPSYLGIGGGKKKVGRTGSWAFKKYYHSITDMLSWYCYSFVE